MMHNATIAQAVVEGKNVVIIPLGLVLAKSESPLGYSTASISLLLNLIPSLRKRDARNVSSEPTSPSESQR